MTIDYFSILPQIILVLAGMIILLLEPFTPPARKSRQGQIAVAASFLAAYVLSFQRLGHPRAIFSGMFLVDNFSWVFQWLFFVITGFSALVALRFNERESINRGEYYALLLFACSGMSLMAASGDLILTFLGIEILSIATYILAGFKRTDLRANESSLKYFLLGSFATAFLLYGIALVYGSTGTTNYAAIRQVAGLQGTPQLTMVIGLGLLLVGFGFKVATVPFHAWAPDVYEGAPTAVTAFMIVGPKAAGFAALIRVLVQALPSLQADWTAILWVCSILTMTVGNVVATLQSNIKRMLAYSAIAHAGYILVGIVANSSAGHRAVIFYLIVYTAMNLGALSIVLSLSRQGDQRVKLEDYAGMGRTQPLTAAALSLFLISLAGIPLTGGFIGKFFLFSAAIQRGYVGLAIIGVLNSVLSVYYYFRLMVYMYMKEPQEAQIESIPLTALAAIAIAALGVLWAGISPNWILNLASRSILPLQ
ncbi:MAG: NADH-quinone oxidoreductase subunit N [Acidobacteriia bacterium]|nr:NADH-quinone oxidoreductase subunit N [Terriglobia bacterium]